MMWIELTKSATANWIAHFDHSKSIQSAKLQQITPPPSAQCIVYSTVAALHGAYCSRPRRMPVCCIREERLWSYLVANRTLRDATQCFVHDMVVNRPEGCMCDCCSHSCLECTVLCSKKSRNQMISASPSSRKLPLSSLKRLSYPA